MTIYTNLFTPPELVSLANYGALNVNDWMSVSGFDNVKNFYWTSSTRFETNTDAWLYSTSFNYLGGIWPKISAVSTWPVRAGSFGDSVMSVTPVNMDFGKVKAGRSASKIVTIKNTAIVSASNLAINSIVLSGADASEFIINVGDGTGGTCGNYAPIISAGEGCIITVEFNPISKGAKAAILRISGSDVNTPNIDIALKGNELNLKRHHVPRKHGNGQYMNNNDEFFSVQENDD